MLVSDYLLLNINRRPFMENNQLKLGGVNLYCRSQSQKQCTNSIEFETFVLLIFLSSDVFLLCQGFSLGFNHKLVKVSNILFKK